MLLFQIEKKIAPSPLNKTFDASAISAGIYLFGIFQLTPLVFRDLISPSPDKYNIIRSQYYSTTDSYRILSEADFIETRSNKMVIILSEHEKNILTEHLK